MAGEAHLRVRLTPRGGRDAVEGVRDGILHVRVAAPPVDGAANEALLRLLAGELGVPRTRVRIATGGTARVKTVAVEADGASTLIRRAWPGIAGT